MKQRKPWLAFLFSLLCPGLGQLYNGNLPWAFAALAVGTALTTFSAFFLFDSLNLLLTAVFASLVLDLFFAIHAYLEAKRLGAVAMNPYQRWWIYIGFAILLYGLPDGYGYLMPQRFRSFQIPSESMLPNLLVGDRLVADGWAYMKDDPKRGDVVVFDYPKDPSVKYVKRVLGIPGDVVEMRAGELYLNGKLVSQERSPQPSVSDAGWNLVEFLERHEGKAFSIYRAQPAMISDLPPVTVPEGSYFVMGDNRDRSNDSRVWGFVKKDGIIGRMAYVYFSWDPEKGRIRTERFGRQIE